MSFEKDCEKRLRRIALDMPKRIMKKWKKGRRDHDESLLELDCLKEIDQELYDIIGYMAIHREQIAYYFKRQREIVNNALTMLEKGKS